MDLADEKSSVCSLKRKIVQRCVYINPTVVIISRPWFGDSRSREISRSASPTHNWIRFIPTRTEQKKLCFPRVGNDAHILKHKNKKKETTDCNEAYIEGAFLVTVFRIEVKAGKVIIIISIMYLLYVVMNQHKITRRFFRVVSFLRRDMASCSLQEDDKSTI